MKASFRISVPEPCNESWDTMLPAGCGRFCNVCEKTVIDFTTFSDQEFIAYFQQAKTIPCGRFTRHQFSIIIPPASVPFFTFGKWTRNMAAGLLAFAGLQAEADAQSADTTRVHITPAAKDTAQNSAGNSATTATTTDSSVVHPANPYVGIIGTPDNVNPLLQREYVMGGVPQMNVVSDFKLTAMYNLKPTKVFYKKRTAHSSKKKKKKK